MLYTLSQIDLGIILNICGSVFINLGNNLQSINSQQTKAQKLKAQEDEDEDHHSASSPRNDRASLVEDITPRSEGLSTQDVSMMMPAISPLMEGGKLDMEQIKSHVPNPEAILKKLDHTPDMKELNEACDTWLVGTIVFLIGAITVFVSYRYAPQSLLAPLGAIQFVTNVIFAREIHHAKITFSVIIATMIIIAGIVIVVHFSPTPSATRFVRLDMQELMLLYTFPAYQVFHSTLTIYFTNTPI
jgi:hypothetical protein